MSFKQIWSWIFPILIGVAVALGIRQWIFTFAVVPSGSMVPTIPYPTYIFVNKISVELSGVHRGEVVTFHFPDDPSQVFVKRIVGMPGDTVTVTNDAVYVNGQNYVVPAAIMPNQIGLGTYHVPAGHYFMMGDNRPISEDSRLWHNKYVAQSALIGKAEFVLLPFREEKTIR